LTTRIQVLRFLALALLPLALAPVAAAAPIQEVVVADSTAIALRGANLVTMEDDRAHGQSTEWTVEASHLRGSVYLISAASKGSFVNLVASIGPDGILLSDAGMVEFATAVKGALEEFNGGPAPVEYVVNTHYHDDHTEGNRIFAPGATVVAHKNTRRNILEGRPYSPDLTGRQLPVLTVQDSLSVHFNGEEIGLLHWPDAHTEGDLAVHFTGSDVLHVGDIILAPGALPFARDVDGLADALRHALRRSTDETTIVPGHGPPATRQDVEELLSIVEATVDYVHRNRRLALPALLAEAPDQWGEWDSRFLTMDQWLERLHKAELIGTDSVAGRPFLAVVNRSAHEVALLDAETWEVVRRLPTGTGPHEIGVAPDGRRAYVPDFGVYPEPHEGPIPDDQLRWVSGRGNTLTVLDLEHRRALRTIDLGECTHPHGVSVSPDESLVWVTCQDIQAVRELDASTGRVAREWNTEQDVSHMVVATSDGRKLFVSNVGSGSVTVIDREADEIVTVPTGAGAEGMALSSDEKELWVANNQANSIAVIDLARNEVTATFQSAGRFPIKLSFTPDGREVWIVNNKSGDLSVYRASDRALIETIELGSAPLGLLMAPDGKRVFVTLPRRNEVRVIEVATRKPIRTLLPGIEPDGLGWVSGARR
jgi:YVTN family beta-propeller protein